MYNYNFECTYKDVEKKYLDEFKKKENKDEDDVEDEDDIYFLCEEIYRIEFIKCFNLEEFNDDVINACVKELFDECIKNFDFNKIIHLVKDKTGDPDLELCFMQLFAYDMFFYTHKCIGQLHSCNNIDNVLIKTLMKKIQHL
jgi:hypothetical protein